MYDDETIAGIEACAPLDRALTEAIGTVLDSAFRDRGFGTEAGRAELAAAANSTDGMLHVIDEVLDFWTLRIAGKTNESDGHWVCTLRPSSSDDDERIAVGRSASLPRALLSAFVRVAGRTR